MCYRSLLGCISTSRAVLSDRGEHTCVIVHQSTWPVQSGRDKTQTSADEQKTAHASKKTNEHTKKQRNDRSPQPAKKHTNEESKRKRHRRHATTAAAKGTMLRRGCPSQFPGAPLPLSCPVPLPQQRGRYPQPLSRVSQQQPKSRVSQQDHQHHGHQRRRHRLPYHHPPFVATSLP